MDWSFPKVISERLDGDQIPEGISRNFIRLPGEDQSDFYLRVTHLHHQRQRIRQIGDLSLVRNLTVLYLYENRLESIERLESLVHLQMLYLQDNRIRGIQGLMELKKLKKLFLSGNRIKRIENLDTLNALTDLYVDRQKLEPGDNLEFDPITCLALKSLQILNTSHNRMTSLNHLHKCRSLTILDASHNQLGPDPIELGSICVESLELEDGFLDDAPACAMALDKLNEGHQMLEIRREQLNRVAGFRPGSLD
eukprot:snap_masked-scaffold42_size484952-processed-gene-3.13 protein:Tk06374 transcript:snap_masked-scaffold42_size484952-processed-gene-3.13-mRNA-1 annotation:"protein phosphatase 1 regulatory subunit 42 isoform x1"